MCCRCPSVIGRVATACPIANRLWVGLVDMAGVMWLQRRPVGGDIGRESGWSRLCDGLGVMWLQRRPCDAVAEEETVDV